MKTQNLNIASTDSLDRNIDYVYDRIRQCPNCGVLHYVRNRARNFCNKRCYDEYYNSYLRNQQKIEDTIEVKYVVAPMESPVQPNQATSANKEIVEMPFQRVKNIQILDSLTIEAITGSSVNIEDLWNLGYDFTVFDEKLYYQKTSAALESYGITIGNFCIFRTYEQSLLILKTITHELQ